VLLGSLGEGQQLLTLSASACKGQQLRLLLQHHARCRKSKSNSSYSSWTGLQHPRMYASCWPGLLQTTLPWQRRCAALTSRLAKPFCKPIAIPNSMLLWSSQVTCVCCHEVLTIAATCTFAGRGAQGAEECTVSHQGSPHSTGLSQTACCTASAKPVQGKCVF
jgi:hypothetical protein